MPTQDLGQYSSAVNQNGVRLNANEPLVAAGATTISGAMTVSGVTSFTNNVAFTKSPTGPTLRPILQSALVGATVVLQAGQTGITLINRSTSGSPSWTLPSALAGLWFTFITANTTAGFTVTGGTINAKTSATGTAITGTTLTNTQATAVVGDEITLVCDGTVWWMANQSGIFAAA